MPNALWYTDIFGLEVYSRMQKLSSCASVNARCNFVADRCHKISVHAVASTDAKNSSKLPIPCLWCCPVKGNIIARVYQVFVDAEFYSCATATNASN